MNRSYYLIGLLVLTTGCQKALSFRTTTESLNIVVDGQSNGALVSSLQLTRAFNAAGVASVNVTNIAVPSTALSDHKQGGYLYAPTIDAVKAARPNIYIWWQGETESQPWAATSYTYAQDFRQFVKELRAEGGPFTVIYVKLSANSLYASTPAGQNVRDQQQTLQGDPSIIQVTVDDIDPADNHIHFSPEQIQIVVNRIAMAYGSRITVVKNLRGDYE